MFSHKKDTAKALEELRAELTALRGELMDAKETASVERDRSTSVADRLAALESRVSGMGAELSRQLHELGTDIERLAAQADDEATTRLVEELRTAQVRLATEQARYEITFRQDLADLADRLLNLPRR